MNAFLGGIQAAEVSKRADRRERIDTRAARQVELNNLVAGYELNEQGEYAPNERGQLQLDKQEATLQQQVAVLGAQNEMIQAQLNEGAMVKATTAVGMGDPKEAWRIISRNPVLKASLNEEFKAASIGPIDWANDRAMFDGSGVAITDEVLNNPEKLNALNSSFFKIVHPDGTTSLGSTQDLIKQTNYLGTAGKQDSEGMTRRFNRIAEILAGDVTTPAERALQNKQNTVANQKLDIAGGLLGLQLAYQDKVLATPGISDKEKLDLLSGSKGVDYKELKAMYETITAKSKSEVAVQTQESTVAKAKSGAAKSATDAEVAASTKNADIEKANLDAEKARRDKEGAKPIVGEADFISNLETVVYNDENLRIATKIQNDSKQKLGAVKEKDVSGRISMAQGFHNFTKKFREADIKYDALHTIGTAMDKILKPGMSTQDREQVLDRVALDSEAKALLAEYVKFMSGAAVTEGEYNRYNDIFKAGTWASKQSAEEAMRSFTNYLRGSARRTIGSMTSTPRDFLITRNRYDVWEKANPELQRLPVTHYDKKAVRPAIPQANITDFFGGQ